MDVIDAQELAADRPPAYTVDGVPQPVIDTGDGWWTCGEHKVGRQVRSFAVYGQHKRSRVPLSDATHFPADGPSILVPGEHYSKLGYDPLALILAVPAEPAKSWRDRPPML